MSAVYLHLVKAKWLWPTDVPVCGYGRDSGGDNQIQSVPQQQGVFTEFVENYQLTSFGFFGDEERLSSTTENRDQLELMLHALRQRYPIIPNLYKREKYRKTPRCIVLVWKFNRLSRDEDYAEFIKIELLMRGVMIVEFAEDPPTGDKFVDDVNFKAKRFFDRRQLEEISANAKRGQASNLAIRDNDPDFRHYNPDWPTQEGRYIAAADGPAPVGFRGKRVQVGVKRRDRTTDSKGIVLGARIIQCLVVDESKWALCYLAWDMRHKGRSIADIHRATHLYPSDKGYAHFFKNRIYTGDYEHGGVIYENFVPALIPSAWFEVEQNRRRERAKKRKGEDVSPDLEPRRVASPSLLSGKLYCESVAGERHPMHAHRSAATKHRSLSNAYECAVHKHTHGEACPYYGISHAAADKAVVETLLRDVLTRDTLRPLVEALNTHLASHHTLYTTQSEHLQAQIAEAEKQRRKYAKLIEADDDPSPTLVSELKRYEREKATLLEQKHQIEATGPDAVRVAPITDAQLDAYIECVRDVLLGADVFLAKRIVDHYVNSVIVKKGTTTGTLYYTFPSDFFSPDLSPLRTPSLEGFRVRATHLLR